MAGIATKVAKRLARVHQLEVPIWKEPDYLCDAMERYIFLNSCRRALVFGCAAGRGYYSFTSFSYGLKGVPKGLQGPAE